jgi:tryptophan synthase alpha chain
LSRIDDIFSDLRSRKLKALIPFVCGCHPKPGATGELLRATQRAGARVIEVGIPFSDPIADGPVIAAAMHEALSAGGTPRGVFEEIAAARAQLDVGLVAMASISIAMKAPGGVAGFIASGAEAGFDGFIFPDAPLEESADLIAAARASGRSLPLLVAPTTPPERARTIVNASTGFVYVLARAGITGETQKAPNVGAMIAGLRGMTDLPLAVGFGISTPDHVRAVVSGAAGADAAIVGSAIVRRVSDAAGKGLDHVVPTESFVRSLVGGLAG